MAEENGALTRYDRPYLIVSEQIDAMSDRADTALDKAFDTLEQLKKITADLDTLPPTPTIELGDDPLPTFKAPIPPNPNQFGTVGGINVGDLDLEGDIGADLQVDPPPEFRPSVISVSIPDAPAPIDVTGMPDRPTLTGVSIPTAPTLNLPSVGDLAQIEIPAFAFPQLPSFDATAPEFTGTAPNLVLQWAEPAYHSDTLEEVKGRVRAMLAGGTGLPAPVEQALFDRARMRQDQLAHKAVDDITQAFAARGFELPPGAMAKQIAAVVEQTHLSSSELAREILIKSAEWEIENLRNAVGQGIALEGMLIGAFDNMANRTFEVAKMRLQADLDLFNANVALFNARQGAYQTEAGVYQTRLQGELAKLEVFKAQIEGEKAKGELNEQKVRVFTAQLQALSTEVEIYKARMSGAQIESDLNRAQIDAYRADIQAYAEKLSARKIEFDGYESRVRAEQAKIGILEAEARAFAATVQGYESKNNVKIQSVRTKVEVMNAKVQRYLAVLESERARVQAELSNIQALTAAYQADVGRYTAEINAATGQQNLEQARVEAKLRNNLAYYEIELKKYDASVSRLIQQVQIQAEAIKATGQMSAQLAAGAMAATNVSASMSGAANISSSDSLDRSYSETHTYRYDKDK
ncbi:MAG TPA: hypothetical protein DCR72_00505 [Pseudomonas sp.]|nr:hypothetical protein [Pseudomonas sp.]